MRTKKGIYIWYASYGSNLSKERFLCYIKGGQPVGANHTYSGCRDKSDPKASQEFLINRELYFAKKSRNWENGGVCFIKNNIDENKITLGKKYLITEEQFLDVVKQEIEYKKKLVIDFDKVQKEGSKIIKYKSWYGNIIHLGFCEKHPIYTFTNEVNLEDFNKPSEMYLKTIVKGLKETYNLTSKEISEYLQNKTGIEGFYSPMEIERIVEIE